MAYNWLQSRVQLKCDLRVETAGLEQHHNHYYYWTDNPIGLWKPTTLPKPIRRFLPRRPRNDVDLFEGTGAGLKLYTIKVKHQTAQTLWHRFC